MKALQNYISGLSGLNLPIPKYQFPVEHQKSSRLTYYSTYFNSIEVNSSFYKIPLKRTMLKWAASVPEDFVFTFKLFKEITHCKNLAFDPVKVEDFIQTINHVGRKKGCLLIQFPPGLKSDSFVQLETLLHTVREADAESHWKTAVEFRDTGWYNDEVFDLLRSFGCTLVIQDIPKSATPFIDTVADFMYVRFHGPTGNYRGSYTDTFLHEYTSYIHEWLDSGKKVYVYFNNTAGDAFQNLERFNKLMTER